MQMASEGRFHKQESFPLRPLILPANNGRIQWHSHHLSFDDEDNVMHQPHRPPLPTISGVLGLGTTEKTPPPSLPLKHFACQTCVRVGPEGGTTEIHRKERMMAIIRYWLGHAESILKNVELLPLDCAYRNTARNTTTTTCSNGTEQQHFIN